ncbi:MAG: DUF192 domain-containing protein [Sandaracinaceae bacterium]
MHTRARWGVAAWLSAVLAGGCQCPDEVRLVSDDASLSVCAERTQTEAERERGLMGRQPLTPGEGLLLEWPVETELCFFNRGVGFSIDMVFADSTGAIVAVERGVPAGDETLRCHTAMRVLELAAFEADGFEPGDRLESD